MKLKTLIAFFSCTFAACTTSPDQSGSTEQTQTVIQHHLQALLANDIDGVMADYTEESRWFMADKTFVGLDEIRAASQGIFQLAPAGATELTVDQSSVDGDLFYMTYHGESPVITVPFGSDTFLVVDGKIATETVAMFIQPKS